MSAPMSLVWAIDILGASLLVILSLYAVKLMAGLYAKKRDIPLYSYLYAQTIALAIFAFSRSFGHILKHVLNTAGYPEIWQAVSPVSGSINSLAFVIFGLFALLYSNIRAASERVDALEREKRKLKVSEEKYRSLFDNANDAIYLIDPQTQKIIGCNKKASEMDGYSIEELRTMTVMDLHPDDEKAILPDKFREVPEKGSVSGVSGLHHLRKDGTLVPIEVSATMTEIGGERLNLSVVRDVTERRMAEEKLQESESKFRDLSERSLVGVYLIQDWKVKYANPRMAEIVGFTVEELTGGMGPEDVVLPEDWPVVRENLRKRLEGEIESAHYGFRCIRKDGRMIDVEVYGSRTTYQGRPAVVGTLLDITERKRAEEKILQAKEEWERTFDAVTDPIMLLDTEFRIQRLNMAMAKALGVTPEEAVGLTCYEHVHGTEGPISQCPHKQLLEDGKAHAAEVYEDRLGGYYLVSVSPFYDSEGRLIGSVHYARDITERKRAEEELHRVNRTLRTISECNQALVRSENEADLLHDICRIIVEHGGYRLAWVGYAEHDEAKTVRPVAKAGYEEGYLETVKITWADTERGRGPIGTAIRTQKPFSAKNILTEPTFAPWRDEAAKRGYASVIGLPLIADSKTYGALGIYASEPDAFDEEEINLLMGMAEDMAYGIMMLRIRDEHRQAEEKIRRQLERQRALRTIDTAISASLDLRLTLDIFVEQVISQMHVDAADVLLLNPNTLALEYAAGKGFRTEAIKKSALRLGEGCAGRVALAREPVIVPDISGAEMEITRYSLIVEEGFKAYFGIPLKVKGQVKGVLELFCYSPFEPDAEWLEFLESLAGQASIAIDNATLFDELQRSNVDLMLAYDTTIEGWSRALDYRDKETEGHSKRVTELTLRVARAMGISEAELAHVRRGALLHDIGKLGIPDSILFKPGKLTDEEWEIMKQHPVIAHKLLSPITFLRPAMDIPYCHHEKWDGTGYPHGFKGEQIPLAARIFAVVDVWDALLSDRPYRPAWPKEKATEYLRSNAGTHFDPEVVEVFLRIVGENP